jgi:hypothetical protein
MHARYGVTPRDRHCWYRSGTCRITALLRAPQRAQWMVGEPLPPKAALTGVPDALGAELPARAAGHEYVEVHGDVKLVVVHRVVVYGVSRNPRSPSGLSRLPAGAAAPPTRRYSLQGGLCRRGPVRPAFSKLASALADRYYSPARRSPQGPPACRCGRTKCARRCDTRHARAI